MKFELPPLPYAQDALEPVISERTVQHHYGKHHAGYMTKLEDALPEADKDLSLEEIIAKSEKESNDKVYNSAAQVWNHTFYWNSMNPDAVSLKDGKLKGLIEECFGSVDGLLKELKASALGEFGSGWVWLLHDGKADKLEVRSTTDAVNPLSTGLTPLLTLDVWEHAYYLDHQQDRGEYVDGFLSKLINWEFAEANL